MALAGKWEFPGGKVEPGETREAALVREILEELRLRIRVDAFLGSGTALVNSTQIFLDVFACSVLAGELLLREHAQAVWVPPATLLCLDWAEADVPVLGALQAWLRRGAAEAR